MWIMYWDFLFYSLYCFIAIPNAKFVQLSELNRYFWEKILSGLNKNREREKGKFLICIKTFIYNSRVKPAIQKLAGTDNKMWIQLFSVFIPVFMHVDRGLRTRFHCNEQFVVHVRTRILCW